MSVDITRLTAHLSPEQQDEVKRAYRRRHENSTAAFLWCFFFGTLGAHRFYLKQWGAGFLRLLVPLIAAAVIVAGIVFNLPPAIIVTIVVVLLLIALLWEIIDLFRIDQEVYNRNLKLAEKLIGDALLQDKTVERQADAKMENLMLDARSEAAASARAERQEVMADAAAVPPVKAPAASDEAEAVSAEEEQRGDAAAVAEDTYVAHTVSEISEDPNATQHAARYQTGPQNDWSATEIVHAEDEGPETTGEPGAIGAAGAALGTAAVAGYALDEIITRTHGETDHSTADSLETHAMLSAADAERQDEAVAVEAADAPPALAEVDAEAPTWPDHPPVAFEEPALAEPQPATTFDVTDTTGVSGGVKPIADIEPTAAPLIIALPALASMAAASDAEPEYADAPLVEPEPVDATEVEASDMVAADAPSAAETSDAVPLLLVPVAEASETSFGGASSVDAPVQSAEEAAVPEESYIPPTVPVVTAEPAVEEPAVVASAAIEPEQPEQPEGETLAELAPFAVAAGAGVVAAEALSHRAEDQSEPQPSPEPALTSEPESAPEPAAPVAAEPASIPEGVPVVAAAAPVAAEAAAEAAPQPRRQLRRIREHLQVRREGQVVEELVAEDLIDVDQDPEPARLRLREQLHQQAVERGLE